MKISLIALIIAILFFGFSVPFIIRAEARKSADHILYGRLPGTEKQIKRCIVILTWCNKRITARTEHDILRIVQLSDMLKEMQHPHG